jgi:pimeloyl-ACP methyl ester carboxylesterase
VSKLGAWKNDRDSVFCERVAQDTEFGVHCPKPYASSFEWSDKERRNVPWQMTKAFYKVAKDNGYKWIHLVGYSGGGAVASSVLAHHSDKKDANMIKSLIVINGPIAEREGKYCCIPYTDGAYYAERTNAKTLLIYGDSDPCRRGVDEWRSRNKAEVPPFYHGGHDFGETSKMFDSVTKTVTDWLKNSPDQGVLRLRRRKRHVKKRAKKGR